MAHFPLGAVRGGAATPSFKAAKKSTPLRLAAASA